jgi:hypothetical protein
MSKGVFEIEVGTKKLFIRFHHLDGEIDIPP